MGKGCHLLSPQHDTGEWDHPQKLPALFMRTDLPGAGGQQGVGLGAQHHSSTPRSPFGFAWALQHRPRALCWQDEDASDGLSSFPEPHGHASTQSNPRARRLEMPPGNSPGRAARRGSVAEAPACCTRGRERGAAASPAAATEQTGNLAGSAPLGHSWGKRGKMLGFAAASSS